MKFESARSLKAEVQHDILLTAPASDPNITLAQQAEREDRIPNMAIGITCSKHSDDYQLALRLESAKDLETPEIARILALSRGEVDIQVTGPISALTPEPGEDHRLDQQKMLRIGSTISVIGSFGIGTLGVFVRQKGRKELCILSNNHVIASENRAAIGSAIYHWAGYGKETVGKLVGFEPLTIRGPNEVDAAIARLDGVYAVDMASLSGGGRFTGIANTRCRVGMAASKIGVTSGRTFGTVRAIEMDFGMHYSVGRVSLVNQIEINGHENAFSRPGDSGSMVMDRNNNAIGLNFASSRIRHLAYCNPIEAVLRKLNIELVNSQE